ncbi:MAG: anti-sigma factor family protein, partial [Acidimicrobiia bacterium]
MSGPASHLGDALSALADGQLPDDEAAAARDHVASCASCAAELAAVEQVRALVRGLGPVEPRRPLVAVPRVGPASRRAGPTRGTATSGRRGSTGPRPR